MSHDPKYTPIIQSPHTSATAESVRVTWYASKPCDCRRCRTMRVARGAGRRVVRKYGEALERLGR